MNFFKTIAFTVLIAITAISCNKDDIEANISNINPENGPKGTIVTINGKSFGTETSSVTVFFNGKEAEIISINDTEIVAKVPVKAFTGNVKVIVDSEEVVGPVFTYLVSEATTTLIAGNGVAGFADGIGSAAQFNIPLGLAIDSHDNIYVSDYSNHRIRKITPTGVVTTVAGSNTSGRTDGTGASAKFNHPWGVTVDTDNNLYVSDYGNHIIRKITPTAVVSTIAGSIPGFADGAGIADAQFKYPSGITVGPNNKLYIGDVSNNRIRVINNTEDIVVSTFAGSGDPGSADGAATEAQFKRPFGVVFDSKGNLFVADTDNRRIRKITPAGIVTTFAGSDTGDVDGIGTSAKFSVIYGIAIDNFDNILIPDNGNHKIKIITPTGHVTTITGTTSGYVEGSQTTAKFNRPYIIVVDSHNNLIVADTYNNRIRKISFE